MTDGSLYAWGFHDNGYKNSLISFIGAETLSFYPTTNPIRILDA